MSSQKCRVTPFLLLLSVLVAGCFRVALPPVEFPGESNRLLALADRSVTLLVDAPDAGQTAGHQYLLFLMPVTRISVPYLAKTVSEQLLFDGATKGYRFGSAPAPMTLNVQVTDHDVSGFDLLFVRRPAASVALKGTLTGRHNRVCEVKGEFSSFAPFAFEKELNRALRKAVGDASVKLLRCLRL